ncbi:DinB family protein [Salibacterium aidingense]|uniref:DinB family protein n=1 Tax=Salibacterium aidingense TaxID=384933 RepID=UPI0003FB9BEC|nr:DinB family protein [Salibacterium aidingense]
MMKSDGFTYAADMTNQLAEELPEPLWDKPLIDEVGTVRQLFRHIIRVRGVYSSAFVTGKVEFPGYLVADEANLHQELRRSTEEMAQSFENTHLSEIRMYQDYIAPEELLHTAIQHEGIHQGQYYIAFQQAGIHIPEQWKMDWNL